MSECWSVSPTPPASWAADGYDTVCVSDICRIDGAVLATAILGYATLGVPCDKLFVLPVPSFDNSAISGRAISGAAIFHFPRSPQVA